MLAFFEQYPDGYGMNYIILKDKVRMGVESKVSCAATSTKRFCSTFADIMDELHQILSQVESPSAKL
jgi:hypothetical protein